MEIATTNSKEGHSQLHISFGNIVCVSTESHSRGELMIPRVLLAGVARIVAYYHVENGVFPFPMP